MDDDRKQLSNVARVFNLKRQIFAPTRITLKSESCIDNAFTNINECTGEVITAAISYHEGILVKLKINTTENSSTKYRNINSTVNSMKEVLKKLKLARSI